MKRFLIILIACASFNSCINSKKTDCETIYSLRISYDYHNYLNNVKEESETFKINERDVLIVDCDKDGNCTLDNVNVPDSLIKDHIKELLYSASSDIHSPSIKIKKYEYLGEQHVPYKFVIIANYDENIIYRNYFFIREEILKAYSEVRNELSQSKFNASLNDLINSTNQEDMIKLDEIYDMYPIRYTESFK